VKDDPEIIKRILLEAVEKADLVIINAGSGKGSEDFTSSVLSGLGELLFNGVAIKPGKPVIAALVHKKPVLGIPGYPVSAFITFRLFAIPLIERLLGLPPKKEHSIRAVMSRQLSSSLGIDEFVRVNVGFVGERHIAAPAGRGAGLLMSVVRADGMVRIPRQLDGIAAGSEVEVEIFRSTEQIDKAVVSIGSHDNALDLLANSIRRHHPGCSLASSHVGSMGGLMAVRRGEAHMAGIHLLDENTGEYNVPFIKAHIPDKRVVLINFVYRIQGLVVKKGNPKGIAGLNDLLRDDIVFVNRQAGSGTRLLLDKSLADLGIDTERVSGYRNDEYTHMAVASSVQTGLADAGLAVFSAAAALGLDFIPIAEERYDLLIPREFLGLDKIEAMIRTLRQDQEFREEVKAMGGYDTRDMGKLLFES
jgi:putative molybdopterin biosynthesis protein